MRRTPILGCCLGALAVLAALTPVAEAKVKLTSDPGLRPAFERGVADYVSRCVPGKPLRLSVEASNGDRTAVAGGSLRSGSFVASVRRRTGAAFAVRVRSGGKTTTHHVRCLPPEFPDWTVKRRGKPQAQWYAITPIGPHKFGYVTIFDARGVPVWWRRSSSYGPWDAKVLQGGTIAWTRNFGNHFGVRPEGAYEERRLDGRVVRTIRTLGAPTDTHDMQRTPNGNRLLIAYRARNGVDLSARGGPSDATVFDAEIQELTPGGKLVWSWNSRDHISPAETTQVWWDEQMNAQDDRPPGERGFDLVHANSVEPDGDGVIVSARHIDAVFRIDKSSGEIDWKLGGSLRPESLTVFGHAPGESPLEGQHDARLYGDGSLTVYDNGKTPGRPPYAVRYRIDPAARTATVLERLTTPDASRSPFVGSARKLPGGNWVVCWGGSTLVTEQKPGGSRVLELLFKGGRYSYRAAPVLPGRLSARSLRAGMSRMNRRKG